MPLELHVLHSSPVLSGIPREPQEVAAAFDRVWALARFEGADCPDGWRGIWPLDGAPDLLLKAQRRAQGRSVIRRTDRAFRQLREIRGLLAFAAAGIPVPDVVAWGVDRHWLPRRTFLIQRIIPDATDFATFLASERSASRRARAIAAVGAQIRALHQQRLFHGDCSPRNLLVRAQGDGFDVFLLDCPKAATRAPRWRHAYLARADRVRVSESPELDPHEVRALLQACGETRLEPALRMIARVSRRTRRLLGLMRAEA